MGLSDISECRALVVGGCGYLGRRLVEFLGMRGTYSSVVVLDRVVPPPQENIATTSTTDTDGTTTITKLITSSEKLNTALPSGLQPPSSCDYSHLLSAGSLPPPTVSYVQGDVRRVADLVDAIRATDCDVVFHLASPSPHLKDEELFESVNVQGTKNVLEACSTCGVRVLVYCSSASVAFGKSAVVDKREEEGYANDKDLDHYNRTKKIAEQIILEADNSPCCGTTPSLSGHLRTVAVRPHMIFGPGDPITFGGMITQMKDGKSKLIVGDGEIIINPTYVDNVCWGLLLAAEHVDKAGGLAINITNEEPVNFWALFSHLCGAFGYPRPQYRIPRLLVRCLSQVFTTLNIGPSQMSPRRVDLVSLNRTYNGNRARRLLNYEPLVRLRPGLQRCIDYSLQHDEELAAHATAARSRDKQIKKTGDTGGLADSTPQGLLHIGILQFVFTVSCIWSISSAAHLLRQFVLLLLSGGSISTTYNAYVFNWIFPLCSPTFGIFVVGALTLLASFVTLSLQIVKTRSTLFGGTGGLPLVGDLQAVSRKGPAPVCIAVGRANFDCYVLHLLGKPVVFMTGRDGYEFLFKATDDELSLTETYKISKALFGEKVIYDVDLEERQEQFHFMTQGLADHYLKQYTTLMLKECKEYFKDWGETGVCEDLPKTISELITFTACRCLLGREIREEMYTECQYLLEEIDRGVTPIGMVFPFFPLPSHRRRDRARVTLQKLFGNVILRRRSAEGKGVRENDMLEILMEAKTQTGAFSDSQIAGMLLALLFGGQHTSSATTSWTLINILCRAPPQVVHNLLEEQRALHHGDGITFDSLSTQTDVLGSCIIESLRLSHPLTLVLRYGRKRRGFKGHIFPKGTIYAVCTHEGNMNQDLYKHPYDFIPDRWMENDWDEWRQMYQFIGFGAGRHTCMGRRFAYMQIKTIVSYVLQTFLLKPMTDDIPKRDELAMVVCPNKPFPVRYERIDGNLTDVEEKWTSFQTNKGGGRGEEVQVNELLKGR